MKTYQTHILQQVYLEIYIIIQRYPKFKRRENNHIHTQM